MPVSKVMKKMSLRLETEVKKLRFSVGERILRGREKVEELDGADIIIELVN